MDLLFRFVSHLAADWNSFDVPDGDDGDGSAHERNYWLL